MQAIEVTRSVFEQQRSWPQLSGLVTAAEIVGVLRRIPQVDSHHLIPAVGKRLKARIERGPQCRDVFGQGVAKVLVLAAAEVMPFHDHATAEARFVRIKRGESVAFWR